MTTDQKPRVAPPLEISAESGAPTGRTGIPRTVVALGVVSLLNDLGGDAVAPLLPAFVATIARERQRLESSGSVGEITGGKLDEAWWQILVIRFGDRAGKGVRARVEACGG